MDTQLCNKHLSGSEFWGEGGWVHHSSARRLPPGSKESESFLQGPWCGCLLAEGRQHPGCQEAPPGTLSDDGRPLPAN